MKRKEREELAIKYKQGPASQQEDLINHIIKLTRYCNELEYEISKMCNTCRKCQLAFDGNGDCHNRMAFKKKAKRDSGSNWNNWFG